MMKKKNKNINRGAAILTLIFALLFFIITGRFVYLQAVGKVNGEILAARAAEKYEEEQTLEAKRGTIFDQNGEPIAQDISTYSLVAVLDEKLSDPDKPRHVVDVRETAAKLAPILEVDESRLIETLSKDRDQVEFGTAGRNLDYSQKEKIEKLELPGLAFTRQTNRFYPNGTFASHLIGYAQSNGKDKTTGKMGLEKTLDNYLQEKNGYIKYEQDHYGWKLPNSEDKIVPPEHGKDIYLTIDQKIQAFLEDAMNQAAEEYEPKKIIGVVADPKTGKILAMGQRPSFDPNKRDINSFYNDIISYPFEPGSTMKIYTLAAAIEEGVYNGQEKFQSGTYEIGSGGRISDHNNKGWGSITYNEGIQRSSNVAMANLVEKEIGFERFKQYLSKFHLDKKTGIDLPGEANSKINYHYKIDKIQTAFGQASAITPIQQIQAATAIANDGKMMKPYVIDRIVDPNKKEVVSENKEEIVGQPISKETSEKVLDILETAVTSEKGTGQPFQIDGYDVAGKTGTAQMYENGKLLTGQDNYIFSFMGFAPKDDPEFIVYVAVQQPELEPLEVGSMPVATVFNSVMKNSLQYKQIKPDDRKKAEKEKPESPLSMPDFAGESMSVVNEKLKQMGIEPVVLGNGKTAETQYPEEGISVSKDEKVFIYSGGPVKLPDLTGWSKRDVMKLSTILEIELDLSGTGFVKTQNMKPGTVVKKGDKIKVSFKKP